MTTAVKLWNLGQLLADTVVEFVSLDGRIFVDRRGEGVEALRRKASRYDTLEKAQSWMNIVLIDWSLDQVMGPDWEINDAGVDEILAIFAKAWRYQIAAKFPEAALDIQIIKDDDDVGLRLTQP